jgi:hypothetical protein
MNELQAEHSSEYQWRVWCQYCRRFHYHAAIAGYHAAHCLETTPYTEGGYMLKPPSNNSRAPKEPRVHLSEGMDTLTPNTLPQHRSEKLVRGATLMPNTTRTHATLHNRWKEKV